MAEVTFNGLVENIENNENKVTEITSANTTDEKYPSVSAVVDYVSSDPNKEEWQYPTVLLNGFKDDENSPLKSAGKVMYRKIGSIVFIRGAVYGNDLKGKDTTVFVLPEGYRPTRRVNCMGFGSGSNPISISIAAAGNVFLTIPSKLGYKDSWSAENYETLDCCFSI